MRARLTIATALLIAAAGLGTGAPVAAQGSTRVLTIFGGDKCPTSNGEEVVICNRLPEADRFRIPENLRTTNNAEPEAQARVDAMQATGRTGIGSCSADGPGGMTGCTLQQIRQGAAEKRAAKATARVVE